MKTYYVKEIHNHRAPVYVVICNEGNHGWRVSEHSTMAKARRERDKLTSGRAGEGNEHA